MDARFYAAMYNALVIQMCSCCWGVAWRTVLVNEGHGPAPVWQTISIDAITDDGWHWRWCALDITCHPLRT
jgi:hypothetical protein